MVLNMYIYKFNQNIPLPYRSMLLDDNNTGGDMKNNVNIFLFIK